MTASRKSEEGVSRPKQKKTKQIGMTQLLIAGVGVVLVIVLALLLFGGGGKKPAAKPKASADSLGESGYAQKPKRAAVHRAARAAVAKRDEERAKRRAEKLERREEARASGGRTTRTPTGGYVSGGTRVATAPSELRAIIDDGSGTRAALVGERRLRAGDDIEGRRIVEVSNDGVKVEYRQSTYTVKVGQKVY